MKYICDLGLYHDKPCEDGKPSSNNGWVYSAIARTVGLFVDVKELDHVFAKCILKLEKNFILITRLPGKQEPPLSFDEIFGLYILGFVDYKTLADNHFVFHGQGKEVSKETILEFLKGLFRLLGVIIFRGKNHRNFFWQYEIVEMYNFAFRCTPAAIYFFKKDNGIKTNWFEKLSWKLFVKTTIEKGSDGENNILYVMASRLGDKSLIKKIDPKTRLHGYFGDNHPIVEYGKHLS